MAISAATKTSDFAGFIKPEMAQAYFDQARKSSVVQQLARRVPLGASGVEIPVVTSKATAGWVSEAGQKPASNGALGLKSMAPKKIAAIAVVSAEVVRANPGNYMQILRDDIAEAFATTFDAAALHGTDSPFGTGMNLDATTKSVTLGTTTQANGGTYGDLVAGLKLLVDDKKKLNGWAFDSRMEPTLLASVDLNGRPLHIESPATETTPLLTPGRILSRPSIMADGVAADTVLGYGGDWSQVVWGAVGGITYDVSTEATVTIGGTLTSLWEHNLVAIRAEAEFGFLINDVNAFVKFAPATA